VSIAIIPARGGSKRIPRKNVREFCGRPMLAWSIRAARASGCFERIVVSTDDEQIAAVATEEGAEVPFLRPATLADDFTGTVPVVAHAMQELGLSAHDARLVCCIYPTAPLLDAADLRRGHEAMQDARAAFAVSVTTYAFPIERALRLRGDGLVEMLDPLLAATRSQDLEERYHDAGQFYWGRAAAWFAGKPILACDAVPVVIPRHRVQDIDTPEDWATAEWMFQALAKHCAGENR
jgi:pseudaminic acid cytidylyltransferase